MAASLMVLIATATAALAETGSDTHGHPDIDPSVEIFNLGTYHYDFEEAGGTEFWRFAVFQFSEGHAGGTVQAFIFDEIRLIQGELFPFEAFAHTCFHTDDELHNCRFDYDTAKVELPNRCGYYSEHYMESNWVAPPAPGSMSDSMPRHFHKSTPAC